jgi:hypothetical protein
VSKPWVAPVAKRPQKGRQLFRDLGNDIVGSGDEYQIGLLKQGMILTWELTQ